MANKARDLRKMILSECGGKLPRTKRQLRETKSFAHISEAMGVDERGREIPGGKCEFTLGNGPNQYRLRDLFEQLVVNKSDGEPVGSAFVQEFFGPGTDESLYEAGGAMDSVDSSLFMGITGQLLITKLLEGSKSEEFVATGMVPAYDSPLEQEKWPGVTLPKDPGKNVLRLAEGEPYKMVGFNEEYVQTQVTLKEGIQIGVTKEAIFFDRTAMVAKNANSVGYLLGLSKEKELLGMMIGGTTDPILYTEKRAYDSAPVTLDLFQAVGGTGATQLADAAYAARLYPFVNEVPSNALTDYTKIQLAEKYFDRVVDPNTGEPIVVGKPFVFATQSRKMDLYQILRAQSVFKSTGGGIDAEGGLLTQGVNPLTAALGMVDFKISRQLRAQMIAQLGITGDQADACWFYGDAAQAFQYMQNWPITVVQAPANSEAEFNQDIVLRWKASRRGRGVIQDPRCWQRHNHP